MLPALAKQPMDTPTTQHLPGRASHGAKLRRYIIRDLVGTEGSDWAADLPSEPRSLPAHGFPFRQVRRWSTHEVAATLQTLAAANKISLRRAVSEWSAHQTKLLSEIGDRATEIVYLDTLNLDLRSRSCWRRISARDLWRTFQELKDPGHRSRIHSPPTVKETRSTGYLSIESHPGPPSCLPIRAFEYHDSCFAPFPQLLAELRELVAHPRGYWNVQHALLTTEDFIATLSLDALAARTARALAAATGSTYAPVAHTLLVRPPDEWVLPLSLRRSSPATLAEGVKRLCRAMLQAGVRPLSAQPPAVISDATPLHTVSKLAGRAFIDPVKVELLHGSGVNTIADLCSLPAHELPDRFPVMPSDLIAISETFTALGHRHTYAQDALVPLA